MCQQARNILRLFRCYVSIFLFNSASHMYSYIQTFLSRIHIYISISISSYSYLYLVRNTLIAYKCVRTSWFLASNTREASLDVVGVRVFIRRSLCNLRLRGLFGRHHNRTGLQVLHQYLLKIFISHIIIVFMYLILYLNLHIFISSLRPFIPSHFHHFIFSSLHIFISHLISHI